MKEFSQEYVTVAVVDADGKKFQGVVLNEDSFTLQMIDSGEKLHLLQKDKVKSLQETRESLMPAYDKKMLSDKEVQDVVAYLLSIGATNGGGQ
jgi:mono/diheme cytochrome c family protein